jgi:two-component system OmpR family response regulator
MQAFQGPSPLKFSSSADHTQAGEGRAKRVLVVEDDAVTSNALRQLISAAGHKVVVAGTVAAAIVALDDNVDTVVLDLMLPDGDGAEVLQRIRAAGLKARVCVTTGVSSPGWLMRVQALGVECILQKPIDLAELLEKL